MMKKMRDGFQWPKGMELTCKTQVEFFVFYFCPTIERIKDFVVKMSQTKMSKTKNYTTQLNDHCGYQ